MQLHGFFGRFMACPAVWKSGGARLCGAALAVLPSVARRVEEPAAGAMEQDPSPACMAWPSLGLLPDPASRFLCLWFPPPAPGLALSHRHRVRCVCPCCVPNHAASVSGMSSWAFFLTLGCCCRKVWLCQGSWVLQLLLVSQGRAEGLPAALPRSWIRPSLSWLCDPKCSLNFSGPKLWLWRVKLKARYRWEEISWLWGSAPW